MLNSRLMSSLLAASSNNVGGGQWNLSKRFVTGIPWVKLGKDMSSLVRDLSQIGEAIHLGTFPWSDAAAQDGLNDLAALAFKVSVPIR